MTPLILFSSSTVSRDLRRTSKTDATIAASSGVNLPFAIAPTILGRARFGQFKMDRTALAGWADAIQDNLCGNHVACLGRRDHRLNNFLGVVPHQFFAEKGRLVAHAFGAAGIAFCEWPPSRYWRAISRNVGHFSRSCLCNIITSRATSIGVGSV